MFGKQNIVKYCIISFVLTKFTNIVYVFRIYFSILCYSLVTLPQLILYRPEPLLKDNFFPAPPMPLLGYRLKFYFYYLYLKNTKN